MKSEDFELALKNKRIPILVLDQKWHRLFAVHGKTDEIKEVEAEVNSALALQGKLTNENKELKKVKSQLMENIVQNMEDSSETAENKRLIDEINDKIANNEDALLDLPSQIKESNEHLMLLSMDYFYNKIRLNQEESDEIEAWIKQIRIDLKKNIIKKQNRDINNKEIYSYLHDIFGAEVIELFDIKYDSESSNEPKE